MIALASLSESARKIALDRFRLLQPHLEEKRPLKAVARDAGIEYRTAQRWVMRYRKCGLAGLARNDRADRGCRRTIRGRPNTGVTGRHLNLSPAATHEMFVVPVEVAVGLEHSVGLL